MAQQDTDKSDTEDGESIIQRFRGWLTGTFGEKQLDNSITQSLKDVLEEHEEAGRQLPLEEQKMLANVLDFGQLKVTDIMTPRADIKAVEYAVSLETLKQHVIEYRHTRIPVYNDTLDNIKGFIHIKDLLPLLASDEEFSLALVLRNLLFVPPSMLLSNLLLKMRNAGVHMAIVVDEYGGTDGLVTLEDIFEVIVGEIQDEHDEDDAEEVLVWNEQGYADVDARIWIEKIEQSLGVALPASDEDAEYDTLAGLILYQIDHVPVNGEIITYNNITFEILEANPRTIKKVRMYKPVEVVTAEK